MSEMVKMFLCGVAVGGSIVGAIAVAVLMDRITKAETRHDKYVKEWYKANRIWRRHPRMNRHKYGLKRRFAGAMQKRKAPLPMNLWGN